MHSHSKRVSTFPAPVGIVKDPLVPAGLKRAEAGFTIVTPAPLPPSFSLLVGALSIVKVSRRREKAKPWTPSRLIHAAFSRPLRRGQDRPLLAPPAISLFLLSFFPFQLPLF